MALSIRLRRQGKHVQPYYRVVVADSKNKRDGRFIELLGHYDPLKEGVNADFNNERCIHWLKEGAIPTVTVKNLMKKTGLWMRWSSVKDGEVVK